MKQGRRNPAFYYGFSNDVLIGIFLLKYYHIFYSFLYNLYIADYFIGGRTMKRRILAPLFLLFTLVITGCKKDPSPSNPDGDQSSVDGTTSTSVTQKKV